MYALIYQTEVKVFGVNQCRLNLYLPNSQFTGHFCSPRYTDRCGNLVAAFVAKWWSPTDLIITNPIDRFATFMNFQVVGYDLSTKRYTKSKVPGDY